MAFTVTPGAIVEIDIILRPDRLARIDLGDVRSHSGPALSEGATVPLRDRVLLGDPAAGP